MNESKPKITIEGLLRLKRAERPPPEFWARFESDIRAKQLAAIVVRRPIWDVVSRIFAVVYRHQLPFGAAAALALTWVGVHYTGGPSPSGRAVPVRGAEPSAVANIAAPSAPVVTRAMLPEAKAGMEAPEAAPVRETVVASGMSHLTKAPEATLGESVARSPFADGIAVTLADFRETQSDIARRDVFGSDQEFEASVASARQPLADPLARVNPSGERLERLLAPALPPYSPTGARSFAGDRMRQKASDDRIYESMDRYGAGGMSLEFRF